MMELTERRLSGETIFEGKVIRVRRDTVQLPDGGQARREVVDHPGGVCVLAMDEHRQVLLVRQFRYPFGEVLLELPAGKLEYGEDPESAGLRELQEETGAKAGRFESLGYIYPSPGYCGEVLHLYLAGDLTFGEAHPDEGEFLSVERMDFDELAAQILEGKIRDGKTVAAVLKAKIAGR